MVRVTNPVTGQRALIRGKSSEVLDLQFAHMKSQIMLASIETTALHIHKIETINNNIICTLLLKIDDPIEGHVPKFDKINWCPYVPENETETDNDAGKLLVWTRGSSFQCYNVGSIVDTYGVCILSSRSCLLFWMFSILFFSIFLPLSTLNVNFLQTLSKYLYNNCMHLGGNTSCERINWGFTEILWSVCNNRCFTLSWRYNIGHNAWRRWYSLLSSLFPY